MVKVRGPSKPILTVDKGGLGPKSLRGNRFYKGHRDIAEKASNPLKTKVPHF
jgi:hypothetical protein